MIQNTLGNKGFKNEYCDKLEYLGWGVYVTKYVCLW